MKAVNRHISASAMLLAVLNTPALPEEPKAYMCAGDKQTGFQFDNGAWKISAFHLSKFILKRTDNGWFYQKLGDSYVGNDQCYDHLNGLKLDMIFCDSGLYKVRMNKKTLRVLFAYLAGYEDGNDNNDNTPTIGIGTCTPL
jgi:hypothetical protein